MPGFLDSCSSRASRPSWSTLWCCTLSGFSDICATSRFRFSGEFLSLRSLSGVMRPRTPVPPTALGAPAPSALPSIPASDIELSRPPSPSAAAGTASGPAADNAAATVLMAGVAVAQLGGTDRFPTNVPAFPMPADTELYSVPRPKPNAPSPAPSSSFGSAPYAAGGANFSHCDTGKLVSSPMSLNPVVKPSGTFTALYRFVYSVDVPAPNSEFSNPFMV